MDFISPQKSRLVLLSLEQMSLKSLFLKTFRKKEAKDMTVLSRQRGALIGAAVGDALGAGYEGGSAPFTGKPEMIGGGFGDFAPFEWTDDTTMTFLVARAAHKYGDLDSKAALDDIAKSFLEWQDSNPPDIGIQIRTVLWKGRETTSGEELLQISRECVGPRSAGNGSLMRTAPVGVWYAERSAADLMRAAGLVSELTHADPVCVQACQLWSLGIAEAIRTGGLPNLLGLTDLIDNSAYWRKKVAEADVNQPDCGKFSHNGWVVTALQAAWSSIMHTPMSPTFFENVMTAAIGIGHDTDTVASIAGAMAGAIVGEEGIPQKWVTGIHGYPNRATVQDLAGFIGEGSKDRLRG